MRTLIKILISKETKLVWLASASLAFLFVLYAIMVNQTISNVLARGVLTKQAPTLRTEVGDLESRYLTLKSKITINFAMAEGFTEVSEPTFIARKSLGQALSLNNEI